MTNIRALEVFFVLLPLCDMSVGWSPESTWFLQALLPSGCEIHRRAHRTACLLRFLVFITRNTEELLSQITWFTYTAETIGIDMIISNHMFSPHPNWKTSLQYDLVSHRFEAVSALWPGNSRLENTFHGNTPGEKERDLLKVFVSIFLVRTRNRSPSRISLRKGMTKSRLNSSLNLGGSYKFIIWFKRK